MSVESVTQAVSDLALAFSDQEEELYAMVTLKYNFNLRLVSNAIGVLNF
jgi:hypothetical protein